MLSRQIDQELNNLCLTSKHEQTNNSTIENHTMITSPKSSSLQPKKTSPQKKIDPTLHNLCLSSKKTAESFNFSFGMIDTDELKKKHNSIFDPEQVLLTLYYWFPIFSLIFSSEAILYQFFPYGYQ